MSNKPTLYIVVVIFIIFISFLVFSFTPLRWEAKLVNPLAEVFSQKQLLPSPSPSPRIKTFDFESSTDLQVELDSVNPEVLDSDFE